MLVNKEIGWDMGMYPPFSDPSFDGLRQPHNLIWNEDVFMFIPLSDSHLPINASHMLYGHL